MGNEELRENQRVKNQLSNSKASNSDLSQNPGHSEPMYSVNDYAKRIIELENQIRRLQEKKTEFQAEAQEKEKVIERELAETKGLLRTKMQALKAANMELAEKTQMMLAIKTNLEAKSLELSNIEKGQNRVISDIQKKLNEKTEQVITLEVELKETKNILATIEDEYSIKLQNSRTMIENLQTERETLLTQIAKLQDVIHQTEEEIKEIETSHLEIQDQLKREIKRTEERAGQMTEDLTRETEGTLTRDRHIRVVLQQTELGRILLFLVDYFANTKKKSLDLGTLSTEVGIPPIICRTHLRHLHELSVCEFNEVTREIKLIKTTD
ncbi:MAG: hypothetical protein ACFFB2_07505 [Promethearchaeota archaeon]